MASATLNILALENWVSEHNEDSVFEYFVTPSDMTSDDVDALKYNILAQAAPFEILYADPDVLRDQIGIWSAASLTKWTKWLDAWERAAEFNPLENFDRIETETTEHSGTDTQGNTQTRNLSGTDNRTANLQDQRTANLTDQRTADLTNERTANLQNQRTANLQDQRTANLSDARTLNLTDGETKNLTDEHKVSAYDVSTYSPKDQDTHTGTDTTTHTGTDTLLRTGTDTTNTTGTDTNNETGTDTVKQTGTDTTKYTGTDTTAHTGTDNRSTSENGTISDQGAFVHGHKIGRQARYHGNIGVTSLAQLLTSYNEAVENWDLIAKITHDFIQEFCIMVY